LFVSIDWFLLVARLIEIQSTKWGNAYGHTVWWELSNKSRMNRTDERDKYTKSGIFTDPEQREFREYTTGVEDWYRMKTTAVTDTTHSIDTTCVFNSCKSTEEAHSWAGPSLSLLRYDSVASARNSVQRRVLVFLSYVLKLFRSYVLILFTIHIFFFLFCYIIKSGFPTFVQQSLLSVGSL
jgi:hypothetical protein